MPETPNSNINERAIDNQRAIDVDRQTARINFLLALLEIEQLGINWLPVDENPLRELRQQIWPA
jgi:hypothetical protein